jgi:hydrogenase maturation protease
VGEGGRASVLVIGVGNPDRGDDGAGPEVAARLRMRGVQAIDHAGDGAALLDLWSSRSRVIVVDAMNAGTAPGRVRCFDAIREPLPRDLSLASSHAFGPAEAIETARALGRLPRALVVYAIEGVSFALGTGLSGPVAEACRRVEREIVAKLRD